MLVFFRRHFGGRFLVAFALIPYLPWAQSLQTVPTLGCLDTYWTVFGEGKSLWRAWGFWHRDLGFRI